MPETKLPSTDLVPPNIGGLKDLLAKTPGPLALAAAQLDPDAIGAGMLMLRLLTSLGKSGTVYYAGSGNNDPQNQAAFTACDLETWFRPRAELPSGSPTILLDSANLHDTRWGDEPLDPIVVIDHHDSRLSPSAGRWCWIEPRLGATSTMVARLLQILEIPLTEDDRVPATLGAFGIYNDTHGLLRKTTSLDRAMFAYLMSHGDQRLLEDLHQFPLPERYYDLFCRAWETRRVAQTTLVASVGEVLAEENTLLARIANQLVLCAGVDTVVLWGLQDGSAVTVKARTISRTKNLNEFIQRHFPDCGGAKGHEGGADFPVSAIAPKSVKTREMFVEYLRQWFKEEFGANGS
jgi:nanoRNase/pAp phosphatase (c-di-AMP/oligoRNAs hydrolase)